MPRVRRGGVGAVWAIVTAATIGLTAQQAPVRQGGTVQQPTAQAPAAPPHGVIAGVITDAITKAPLVRARVELSADCEKLAPPNGPPCVKVLPRNRVTITDEQGRFRFTELPVGTTFVVKAVRTGYAPRAFGELPPGTLPKAIALKADEVLENVGLELVPQVVLAGIVEDEDGTPFAGAYVEALRAIYTEGHRELVTVAEAVTDDHGQFRLSQMAPGQYFISAFDPAFANVGDAAGPLFYSPTYYPSATTPEEATRITLEPGVSREAIVIKLKLIRPARVGGTLRPDGYIDLVAGAIELSPKRNDQYASQTNFRVDIRPNGSYLFENVPPGTYVIRARGETQAGGMSMFGIYTLEIAGTDKLAVDIPMSPGAIVSGFVEWQGRTKPPTDKKTIVIRAPMTDGSLSGDAPTGNLNADNTFRMRGLLRGLHYIRVEGLPPNSPWSLKRVELNGADVTDIPVEYRFGQVETGLRVIFTDTSTDFYGTLLLGARDVMQGYAVIAFSTNPTTWYPRSRQVQLARPTDDRGRYHIHGLPPGEYYLALTRDLDEGDIGNAKALQQLSEAKGLQRVIVRDGERRSVDLRPILRASVAPSTK